MLAGWSIRPCAGWAFGLPKTRVWKAAMNLLYSCAGFGIGVLVGVTGVGGGSLMTPLLILLFGFHPEVAVGTDLLFAATTKTAGTFVHGLSGTVNWRITGLLAAGSIPASMLTLFLIAAHGAATPEMATIISLVLGLALVVTAFAVVLRIQIQNFALAHLGRLAPRSAAILTVVTGIVLGVLVSISSVGAGALGLTALVFLYPKQPIARLVGSDIAHAVPLTLIAGIGHWLLGSTDWALLAALLLGSLPGIVIGSLLATRIPDAALRPILAATLLLAGGRMLVH
jgi:uncharacterized membrane protein YfcA